MSPEDNKTNYRGRLAPSPTGYLHLGHARTFWTAQERAEAQGGTLVLRNEDLDPGRSKPEFVAAMLEDMHWFGLRWQEGPDAGGPFGPYNQGERKSVYLEAWRKLLAGGFIYPCKCSRKDIQQALHAPHQGEDEPVYPGTCRPTAGAKTDEVVTPAGVHWRFRVPVGEIISFTDGCFGSQKFVAGEDFGDFVVWRNDDVPAYQLAVVADDAAMQITEVVRGADLLSSTARQLLLYRALGFQPPAFYHCPLLTDEKGVRLAKRNDALSLRALRARGLKPEQIRANW
ncbi:tRNA glutamyl-Q(34) synthetase GluQRS [Pedosphaera parvula]|uniref:Glutamyl-tRNA synthetase class Ic n=1 Tax=Pedosphaera parvula (strain Ellin514) TaxID=320771 RepID=B9XJ07_PEDPL|nr:tRNA glutamyl-Q(34) synthetase GluQRS [Pedosphaera parvula]EEF60234.1 glutamyl-tRNA synthetase class Ic [Pedosphaera parvula Ellin514]